MSERGIIYVNKAKKGGYVARVHLDNGKTKIDVPLGYQMDMSSNKKACEIEREKGQITKIIVNGKELPKNQKFSKGHSINDKSRNHIAKAVSDIFNIDNTKLPSDTRIALQSFKGKDIENYSLLLNKASQFYDNDKFKFFEVDRKKGIVLNVQPDYSKIDIKAIAERHKKNIEKLNIDIKSIILKPDWRLIVGLGNESVYETSMTLHHIYGIPYIPGSAIKGVVRSYIITEKFGSDEKKALKEDQGFCDIFGCPKESFYNESRQGKISFFDALPLSKPTIKPDIMNPHYGTYYSDSSGNVPPADDHSPKPIFFLTVKDAEFEFIIGIKEKDNTAIQKGIFEDKYPLEAGYEWMKKALNEHGIGAKTAVGYGYLQ
ncbi:RAMP superfamily protein [archaeon BMS3Bbin15]|nr:RAMP superfamily protein [archaeon BMS3Bbin15]